MLSILKITNETFYISFPCSKFLKSGVYFILKCVLQHLDWLNSHTWLVAIVLDGAGLE